MKRQHTDFIVVHCSATRPSQDIGVDDIRKWHVQQKGWSDIGYHIVIRRCGLIEPGRSIEKQGAHVKGHNDSSVGICLVGGLSYGGKPEDNFTEDQFSSLRDVLAMLKKMYPEARIRGHRDFSPDLNDNGIIEASERIKECPCFDVELWKEEYL